jgi:glycosyltransferase involved in cell wall biosynthesis
MLTIQIPTPRTTFARIRNSDFWQNVDLLALPEFAAPKRRLRCVPAPLIRGQIGAIGPLAAARLLDRLTPRSTRASIAPFTRELGARTILFGVDAAADVILAHGWLPWIALGRKHVPLLWGPGYTHEDCGNPIERQAERDSALRQRSSRHARGVFLTTDEAVQRFNSRIGVPTADRVFSIPYFMPRAPRSNAVRALPRSGSTIRLLFVGREARRKNLPAVIEALDGLSADGRSFHLTVVSDLRDGPVDLERRYITHHRQIGNAQVLELMASAHIYVMPSMQESFGLVYVEALAYGCLVVAPRRAAQLDMLREAACYVDPSDVHDIRAGLDRALATKAWADASERAIARYRERFAPDVVAERFAEAAERCARD